MKIANTAFLSLLALAILSLFPGATHAQSDFGDLLRQIPETANSLVMIKSSDIAANAKGDSRQQIEEHLKAAKAWPLIAQWSPIRIVVASELDIQHMAPSWGMAAIEFKTTPSLKVISRRANGIVERLGDQDVVWLKNACLLKTGEKQLTFVSPLNRQSAANWLRRIENQKASSLSPYLAEIADSFPQDDAEIVVALDLKNVFSPSQISTAAEDSPLLKKLASNPAEVLSGIRGLTIRCQVDGEQDSSISFDFEKPTQPMAPIAKELMIGALTKAGAMLGEFDDWNAIAEGNQLSMQGQLSPRGLKRILGISSISSIVAKADSPTATQPPKSDGSTTQAEVDSAKKRYEQTRIRTASKAYFQGVTNALNDVFENQDQNSLEQAALWINGNAKSINRLSTRNVDPELVKFGEYAANSLNDIVGQFHQSDMSRQNRTAAVAPNRGTTTVTAIPYDRINYGGNVGYRYAPMVTTQMDVGAGVRERREIRSEEVGNANQYAWSIKKEVDEETESIRKYLTKKYGTKF